MPSWIKAILSQKVTIIHRKRFKEIINAGDLRKEKSNMSSKKYFVTYQGAQVERVLCRYWNIGQDPS